MLRVLHTSDLHGNKPAYRYLLASELDFDVWVDTGDFLPTKGRTAATNYRICGTQERVHQGRWLTHTNLPARLTAWLGRRPMLSVPGNHDFLPLAAILSMAGVNAHEITSAGIELLGIKWAGFREINWIEGEWPGETRNFTNLVRATVNADPTVLLTHAPPDSILSGPNGYGISMLTAALAYRPHRIKAHLFGHAHELGGQEVRGMGIRFVNGAQCIKLLKLDV